MGEPMPKQVGPDGSLIVPMRLQKFLARAGVASRRGSENLMTAGRVRVNGEVVRELGSKVDPTCDTVEVDGKPVHLFDEHVVIMLNKPAGFLTTMHDPQGRPCVATLVPTDEFPGLFPIGRLDMDTTGLLLFTTDGNLGNALLHPSHHVDKTYVAKVKGSFDEQAAQVLRDGITLDDGPTSPAKVRALQRDVRQSTVEIVIHEGRKRQVKRMCEAVGHPVSALHRAKFGPLSLDGLEQGSWRMLDDREIEELRAAASLT